MKTCLWLWTAFDETRQGDVGARRPEHKLMGYVRRGLAGKLIGWNLVPHLSLVNSRLGAVSGPAVQLVLDQPVSEALQVAVAVPRVVVGLQLFEGRQGQKHLLSNRSQPVVVQYHRLHTVAQIFEGKSATNRILRLSKTCFYLGDNVLPINFCNATKAEVQAL